MVEKNGGKMSHKEMVRLALEKKRAAQKKPTAEPIAEQATTMGLESTSRALIRGIKIEAGVAENADARDLNKILAEKRLLSAEDLAVLVITMDAIEAKAISEEEAVRRLSYILDKITKAAEEKKENKPTASAGDWDNLDAVLEQALAGTPARAPPVAAPAQAEQEWQLDEPPDLEETGEAAVPVVAPAKDEGVPPDVQEVLRQKAGQIKTGAKEVKQVPEAEELELPPVDLRVPPKNIYDEAQPAEPPGDTKQMESPVQRESDELEEPPAEEAAPECKTGEGLTKTAAFNSVVAFLMNLPEDIQLKDPKLVPDVVNTMRAAGIDEKGVFRILDNCIKRKYKDADAIYRDLASAIPHKDMDDLARTIETMQKALSLADEGKKTTKMESPLAGKDEAGLDEPPVDVEEDKKTTKMESPVGGKGKGKLEEPPPLHEQEELDEIILAITEIADLLANGAKLADLKGKERYLDDGIREYAARKYNEGLDKDMVKAILRKRDFEVTYLDGLLDRRSSIPPAPRESKPPPRVTDSMIISERPLLPPLPQESEPADGKKATRLPSIQIDMSDLGAPTPAPKTGDTGRVARPIGAAPGMTTEQIARASVLPTAAAKAVQPVAGMEDLSGDLESVVTPSIPLPEQVKAQALKRLDELWSEAENPKAIVKKIRKELSRIYTKELVNGAMGKETLAHKLSVKLKKAKPVQSEFAARLSKMKKQWPLVNKALKIARPMARKGASQDTIKEELRKRYGGEVNADAVLKNKAVRKWILKTALSVALTEAEKKGATEATIGTVLGTTAIFKCDGEMLAEVLKDKRLQKQLAKNAGRVWQQVQDIEQPALAPAQTVPPSPPSMPLRYQSEETTKVESSPYSKEIYELLKQGKGVSEIDAILLGKGIQYQSRVFALNQGLNLFILKAMDEAHSLKDLHRKIKSAKSELRKLGVSRKAVSSYFKNPNVEKTKAEREMQLGVGIVAKKPSRAGKVLKWVAIGATLAALGGMGYHAYSTGMLDPMIEGIKSIAAKGAEAAKKATEVKSQEKKPAEKPAGKTQEKKSDSEEYQKWLEEQMKGI